MDIQKMGVLDHSEGTFISTSPNKSFKALRTVAQNLNMQPENVGDPNYPDCHFSLIGPGRNMTILSFGVFGDSIFHILVSSTSKDILQQILNQIVEIPSLTEVTL